MLHQTADSGVSSVGFTTGQLARAVGLTRSRIRRWTARGYLVPVYEWHGLQEWAHYPPQEVQLAKRLKVLADTWGMLPSHAARRLRNMKTVDAGLEAEVTSFDANNVEIFPEPQAPPVYDSTM